ncbi:MAG: sulfite exporter TauE/SafE family protein [Clostridiales bacterium]|nr:sulfite exporter TauE/SafE family protein [Clostridiales bacterium]
MRFIIPALAGLVTGILSAWGIGGGSLLVVYMTTFAGVAQQAAQGINLMYFLPTSLSALYSHIKNKLVETKLALYAIIAGVLTAVGASFLATGIDTNLMRKIFGVFIILIGLSEVFRIKGKKNCKDK